MRKSIILLGACAVGCIAAVGATVSSNPSLPLGQTNAVTVQTTRRIWAIDQVWSNLVLYNCDTGEELQMTKVLPSYWNGLYFYDIPVSTTKILFHNAISAWGTNQTVDVILSGDDAWDLSEGDVFYVWKNEDQKAGCSTGVAGCSGAELGKILSYYNTCDPSYAYGYNAYDQVMLDFVTPSVDRDDNPVNLEAYNVDVANNETNTVTLKQKLDVMKRMRDAD